MSADPPPAIPSATPSSRERLAVDEFPGLDEAVRRMVSWGEQAHSYTEIGTAVDELLQSIMHLPNLFIALIDESPPRVRFVYCRDVYDRHVDRPINGLGLTDRVFLTQQPLLLTRETANTWLARGELVNHGVPSQVWLGVPLWVGGRVIGVMATQDYEADSNLTPWHQACLTRAAPAVAGLIALASLRQEPPVAPDRVKELLRQKQALFATVGHDVRSPLAVILGYSDLLRDTLRNVPSGLTAERVFKAAQELSRATDRMLDYAAAEAGVDDAIARPTDLRGWLRSLAAWVESLTDTAGIDSSMDLTASGTNDAQVDGERLRQALQHVVQVAAAMDGVARLQVRLRVQPVVTIPTGLLRLSFSVEAHPAPDTLNTAQPRDDARLQPIRLDDGRTYDGVSVSLAIAQRLAEMLGAEVRVSEGYRVPWRAQLVLTVPAVAPTHSTADSDEPAALAVMREQIRSRASQVLVIDPDTGTRADTVNVLSSAMGLSPAAFAGVGDMEDRLREGQVSVIVAAVDQGPALLREIALALRAAHPGAVLPYLIVVSRDQTPQGVEALLDGGADAYVPRPLNRAALLVALSGAWLEHERRVEETGE